MRMLKPRATAIAASASQTEVPVWLAALIASRCEAIRDAETHSIEWTCISGKALYTNLSTQVARVQPFGITLLCGETLAVSWRTGATEYTLDVYPSGKAADCSRRAA